MPWHGNLYSSATPQNLLKKFSDKIERTKLTKQDSWMSRAKGKPPSCKTPSCSRVIRTGDQKARQLNWAGRNLIWNYSCWWPFTIFWLYLAWWIWWIHLTIKNSTHLL